MLYRDDFDVVGPHERAIYTKEEAELSCMLTGAAISDMQREVGNPVDLTQPGYPANDFSDNQLVVEASAGEDDRNAMML